MELAWGSAHTDISRVVVWAMAVTVVLSSAAVIDQESEFQNSTLSLSLPDSSILFDF